MSVFRRFGSDQKGMTAAMFGLTLFPLMAAVGGAVDYGRATAVHSKLQRAIDAAAVTLVKEPVSTSQSDLDKRAAKLVADLMGAQDFYKVGTVTVTRTSSSITVKAGAGVQNAFMQLFGFKTTDVGSSAQASWGTQKIELALVLDNTGSMNETISGKRKIDALKSAAVTLLGDLRNAAVETDSVKVSLVPFDTEVRLDASTYRYKSWFAAPFDAASWTGYVFDRFGAFATIDDAPSLGIPASLFPAPKDTEYRTNASLKKSFGGGDLAAMRPLTAIAVKSNYDDLVAVVGNMQPRGYTNIALGAMWGLSTLTPSEPFSEAAPTSSTAVKKFMVILTDGTNTASHVNGVLQFDTGLIDTRTKAACSLTKASNIEVFTIRLLDGDVGLLSGCASGPTKTSDQHYFDVQSDTDLKNAFKKITDAITGTRLSS